jgi:hypothetical protein
MGLRRTFASLRVAVTLLWCSTALADPVTSYALELLVADGDIIDGVTIEHVEYGPARVSINNHGVVAFQAVTAFGSAVFTQHNVIAAPGDVIDGLTLNGFPTDAPTINDSGEIAFVCAFEGLDNGGVVVVGQTKEVRVRPGDSVGGHTLEDCRFAAIDEAGNVTFRGIATDGLRGIFTPDTVLVLEGDTIDGTTISSFDISSYGGLAVNGVGGVAFGAERSIFTPNEIVAAPGDSIAGVTLVRVESEWLDMNDLGNIAFVARFDVDGSTSWGTFTQNDLVVQKGDVVAGFELTGPWGAALNNSGVVAFRTHAIDSEGTSAAAVFTQFGPVVMRGDTIGGKTYFELASHQVSINDNGEIAFIAAFRDGSAGVVIARPIPEPSLLLLLVLAAVAAARTQRRRRAA